MTEHWITSMDKARTNLQSGPQQQSDTPAAKQAERLLRLPEVEQRTGLKKSSIYVGMRNGSFPKCVRFGRVVAWPSSRIEQWMAELLTKSDASKQAELLHEDGQPT